MRKIVATILVVCLVRRLSCEDLAPRARISVRSTTSPLINWLSYRRFRTLRLWPFLAISISLRNGELPNAALERARIELEISRSEGGLDLLATQIVDDTLLQRTRGEPGVRLLGSSRTQDLAERHYGKARAFQVYGIWALEYLERNLRAYFICRGEYATGRRMSVKSSLSFARNDVAHSALHQPMEL